VGCSATPRVMVRTAALYPSLARTGQCRIAPLHGLPKAGHAVMIQREGTPVARRVAGLPGDRIAVRSGVLYRNGNSTQIDEPEPRSRCGIGHSFRCGCTQHIERIDGHDYPVQILVPEQASEDYRCTPRQDAQELVVPENHVYLLADNRDTALDSREEGPFPVQELQGRILGCR